MLIHVVQPGETLEQHLITRLRLVRRLSFDFRRRFTRFKTARISIKSRRVTGLPSGNYGVETGH